MIRFENVTYEYGNAQAALQDVDLRIDRGEFVAVIGHNGSGKSTLAKHINALITPTGGAVFVLDMDTRDESLTISIRQHVGMVFQNPDNQMVTTVVEDDVAFGPENLGVEREELRRRVDEAIEAVRMGEFVKCAPHTLSGGQKQRIAVAGILAMRPDIIVFDEPTAMLDPSGRTDVMDTIRKLHGEGITIVLITHFMEEAAMADRIVVVNDGGIAFEGTPASVFACAKELNALGLDVPFSVRFCQDANAAGLQVPLCIDEERLVDEICRLYFKT